MEEKKELKETIKETQIQIDIDEITAQGVYSNLILIAHSESEVVFDFIFVQPQTPKAKVRNRVITSPLHAKRFLKALEENLKKYEEKFGEIKISAQEKNKGIGFLH